jgi:ABC-type transport system involved in multi-copper enzyme maturation permease subunit
MTASSATIGTGRRSPVREFTSSVATIMVKELRSRMRGRRAFVVLTLYLGVLALITYGAYVVVGSGSASIDGRFGTSEANASARIGQSIFSVLSVFQVILVAMIAPAFTAGQISLEREKQTLDLLISTPLRPGAIIIGKLLTALAFVVLMIAAAIPITAIVLMYGGASIGDIVRQQVVLLAVAVGFGAIGLFASALMRRTQSATVLTYCTVLAFTLGTAMVYAFWNEVAAASDEGLIGVQDSAPEQLRYLNPMVGMLDIISAVEVNGPTRFTSALYELFGTDLAVTSGFAVPGCDGFDCAVPPDAPIDQFGGGSLHASGYWWPRVAGSFMLVAVVLTLVSMRLIVPAGMRGFRRRAHAPLPPSDADDMAAPSIDDIEIEARP